MDEDRVRYKAYDTAREGFWAPADAVGAVQEANARLARCFLSA